MTYLPEGADRFVWGALPIPPVKRATDCTSVLKWDASKHPRIPKGSGDPSGEFQKGKYSSVLHAEEKDFHHSPSDALDALAAGEHVNIDPEDVRGFLKKAVERGEDADLTDVHVNGMQIFGGNGLGIAREDMPQIPKEHRDQLIKDLQAQGIEVRTEMVSPLELAPTQKEISASNAGYKLEKYEKDKKRPFPALLVAEDHHVLDGHHHWAMTAAVSIDHPSLKIPIRRIMLSTAQALKILRAYAKAHGFVGKALATKRNYLVVLKYNKEHVPGGTPKGGQFAPKASVKPLSQEWAEGERHRAVFGQLTTDESALDLSQKEVKAAFDLDDPENGEDSDSRTRKDDIARTLGEKLDEHKGLDSFYTAHKGKIDSYARSLGQDHEEVDPNFSAPEPSEAKSDYQEYYDSALEEADNQHYEVISKEYEEDKERAKAALQEGVTELRQLWDESRQLRPDDSQQGVLFGDRVSSKLNIQEYAEGIFLQDNESDSEEISKKIVKELARADGRGWEKQVGIDWKDEEFRKKVREELATYGDIEEDTHWDEVPQLILDDRSEYFLEDTYNSGFDSWRDSEASEPDYDDVQSFDSWYHDQHGFDPDEWEDKASAAQDAADNEESGVDTSSYTKGMKTAAYLINRWAETSGDHAVDSVSLQAAAEREFGLGETYSGRFAEKGDQLLRDVESELNRHGPLMQHFLRSMYNETQAQLQREGIDHVTLYRGTGLQGGKGQQMDSDPHSEFGRINRDGEFVDLLLQPMSSFSSSFDTATGFGGSGWLVATRVPREQIISNPLTGFGCTNEHEWVVLDRPDEFGKQPAFIVAQSTFSGTYSHRKENYWKLFQRTKEKYYNPRGIIVGEGDRL